MFFLIQMTPKYCFLGRQLTSSTVSFLGKMLTPLTSWSDHGVILDLQLTYDNHISQLVSSCIAKLVQINRADKETLSIMIMSLVLSKMFYCSTIWSNLKKLQSIQNFASKILTGLRNFDVTRLLRQYNWLPVKQQLYLIEAVVTLKCADNLAAGYLLFRVPMLREGVKKWFHLLEELPSLRW